MVKSASDTLSRNTPRHADAGDIGIGALDEPVSAEEVEPDNATLSLGYEPVLYSPRRRQGGIGLKAIAPNRYGRKVGIGVVSDGDDGFVVIGLTFPNQHVRRDIDGHAAPSNSEL